MKTTTKRMMMVIIALIFAAVTTSCKKEMEIVPANPTTPPAVPTVSFNPVSIITRNDAGGIIQTEQFHYDNQNVLKTFSLRIGSRIDTATIFSTGIIFRINQGQKEIQGVLSDKSLGDVNFSNQDKIFIEKTANNFLDRTIKDFAAIPVQVTSSFSYTNGSVSRITTGNEVIEITYNNNIAYQKGINELPFSVTTVNKFKVLELGNATSTGLYSKLLQSVVIKDNGTVKEEHLYGYRLDANGRIAEITQRTTTVVSSLLSVIKTVKKEIAY